ncbi:TPA: GNAT family N-acetyltransferase, partial [Streptococcus suis]
MESTDVINEIRGILPRNSIGKYDLLTIFTHKTVFDKIVKVLSLDFDIDNLKGFLNDTSSFGFIAKENNKIIGFAYCYTLLRPDGKTMFYLHSIGMLPNYQDKGYGSKLLSFIKEYSKEIGCSEMFL